jgi:hypothetical protein
MRAFREQVMEYIKAHTAVLILACTGFEVANGHRQG